MSQPTWRFSGFQRAEWNVFQIVFFFSSFYLIVQYRGERASWHAMRGVYDFFFYWPSLLLAYCCCWTRIAKMFHLHRRIRLHGSQLKLAPVAIYFPCPAQLLLLPFFFLSSSSSLVVFCFADDELFIDQLLNEPVKSNSASTILCYYPLCSSLSDFVCL